MLTGRLCQWVKSPTNWTLRAEGARNANF
jgi:hypothetical protein